MNVNIKILILVFIVFPSSLFSEGKENRDIKIPTHVFLIENLFIPGAGHIYNDHLGLAFWSFFGTIEPLIFSSNFNSEANKIGGDPKRVTSPSIQDLSSLGGQKCFLDNREYYYNIDARNMLYFLFVINYIDSFIESYYAANRGFDDNLNYELGFSAFVSAIKTRSVVNGNANIANSQDAQMSTGLSFSAHYGRIFEKEASIHFGPHFVMSYDFDFPIKISKWASFFIGNSFEMQKKIFSLSLNAPWTSYDRYVLINDIIGLGISVSPVRWMKLKAGMGIFTLGTVWQSFFDSSDPSFSQAHAGKTGLFTTTQLWGSGRIDVYKDFFIGGRFKYISAREPQPNYNVTTSYINFIRLEAILGVSF